VGGVSLRSRGEEASKKSTIYYFIFRGQCPFLSPTFFGVEGDASAIL